MEEEFIMKVWVNKKTGQKFITIPKSSDIILGDYVIVKKIKKTKR